MRPSSACSLCVSAILAICCLFSATVNAQEVLADFPGWGNIHVGRCLETCCCKVCSSATSEAFPYGLLSSPPWTNPVAPTVVGASCKVPTWGDQKNIKDINGNAVTPPDTLYWNDITVFGDTVSHFTPYSCDCCQLSIDTSCQENAPIAAVPKEFRIGSGIAIAGQTVTLVFEDGVALSSNDYVQIRNDTFCGYENPGYTLQSAANAVIPSTDETEASWTIDKLPPVGCYKVCYYQSNLTTTGWYPIGDLTVHQQPQTVASFRVDPRDVLLEGNTVTITFFGQNLVNVFEDIAELRPSPGTCFAATPAATTTTSVQTNGKLEVLPGADWCHPPVVPKISERRPLQYIPVQYTDCNSWQRNYLDAVTWTLVLPAANTYDLCYQLNGTQLNLGTLVIPARATKHAALLALYTATGGGAWTRQHNWDLGSGNECQFYGVKCDSSSNIVGIFLGRNNLEGTLPAAFFLSDLFDTLEDLKLDMNVISGGIPFEVGAMRKLRVLDLSTNQLSGDLPISLVRTQLQILYLSENAFVGPTPSHVEVLRQQFVEQTGLIPYAEEITVAQCPAVTLICSDRGSTDAGVSQCGHAGITEPECLVRGCCFNAQAPLTFGGTACFTKKAKSFGTHPPCQTGAFSCVPQEEVTFV